MESFIRELEEERIRELNAYLLATGLKDYALSAKEEKALESFKTLQWREFNLENLYGKSTRGKRLKGEDRIKGELPFVTAGEAETGISAYISNDVEIFSKNTTTIDMFGSAKYRNYNYGADDHVAVVHTEELPKHASIFVTSAIHKSSHTGKFDYSNNFYASDADELNIQLPTKNNKPDYATMETFIKAVEKLVIKDVVLYADSKIKATKNVVKKDVEYKINEDAGLVNVAEK
nr:restriction endonuclease subunit S [uncultured Treponema sp.]